MIHSDELGRSVIWKVCRGVCERSNIRSPIPRGVGVLGEVPRSLTDVLPEIQTLSRLDKIRLIQFLTQELVQAEENLIKPGQSYPVWSPDQAFPAAAALLQALEDDKGKP